MISAGLPKLQKMFFSMSQNSESCQQRDEKIKEWKNKDVEVNNWQSVKCNGSISNIDEIKEGLGWKPS